MVKVQKPVPKSLDKMGKAAERGNNKKSAATKAKSKVAAGLSTKGEKKVKLLTETVETEKEVLKATKDVGKVKAKTPSTGTAKTKEKKQTQKTENAKIVKKVPLILAPPESPAAAAAKPPAKVKKAKQSTKAPLTLAPPESPAAAAAAKPPVKVNKAEPAKKAALILAPPESPAAAAAKPPAKVKKAKKAALILAPPESPAAAAAAKPPPAKVKTAKKAPLILAPPESPAATKQTAPTNKKKKQAALIPAAQNSPVQPAVKVTKQTTGAKKPAAPQQLAAKPATTPKTPPKKKANAQQSKKQNATPAKKQGTAAKNATAKSQPTEASQPLTKKQRVKTAKRAFIKQLRAKTADDAANEVPKAPKQRTVIREPLNFDEAKFDAIVSKENVEKIVNALKTAVTEELKKQKTSIFNDSRFILNVTSFKISNVPRRMVKLGLKHSLVPDGEDVPIIVPDLQRGAKVDFEPTIHHYEDLFRELGITNLKIVPFNQLRNEMGSFEQQRKFLNSYDYFLCDGRLVGHAHGFLGQKTQKPRTVLHAVQLHKKKESLKAEIERGLRRTAFRQLLKGDLVSIPVGNNTHSDAQLAENVIYVVEQLKKLHPGGYTNVRTLHLRIDIKDTSSLPIYVSVSLPPEETPYVVGLREQRMLKLKNDANKALARFTLTKEGNFIKLNSEQVAHKRQLREAHAKLTKAEKEEGAQGMAADEPKDDDGDNVVPTKKRRKDVKEDEVDENVAEDDGDADDDNVEAEGDEEGVAPDDTDDDDNDEEDDDDDEEGDGEDDAEGADDDDDDDDDEDEDDSDDGEKDAGDDDDDEEGNEDE